jgi:hypothetical protein
MKKILVLLLILNAFQLVAQDNAMRLKLGVTGGYNFYNPRDLKSLNQEMISQLPFEAKVVDDFKPGFSFGAFAQYELFKYFTVWPSIRYMYMGSRVGQHDYSGTYSFDQYLKSVGLGLKFDYFFVEIGNTAVSVQMDAGWNISSWKMESNLEVGGESQNERQNLSGIGWYTAPALCLDYEFMPDFSILATAGYSFDIIKNYHYNDNRDLKLIKKPDWKGLRLSLGIEYTFKNL